MDCAKEDVSMMKRIMLGGLALMLVIAMPAMAGKNNGGAMLVHTDDAINYTFFAPPDYCVLFDELGLAVCEDITTQSNFENALLGTMVWFVAAFHPDADPGVTVAFFGLEHNLGAGIIAANGFCGPANTLEVPDAGWPEDWENAGNSVAFGDAITGRDIFPFYYFGVYGTTGDFISTGINPLGKASFVSDDIPGFEDIVERFGTVRWFAPGSKDCPEPPVMGACCLADATCELLFEAECESATWGGTYQGDGTTCEVDCGACCYWRQDFDVISRRCVMTTADDCLDVERWNAITLEVPQGDPPQLETVGADWSYPGAICTSDPEEADVAWYCQDPRDTPTATGEISWGKLKSLYR